MDCKDKDIDYFLFLKKKQMVILSYLTEIINSYQEVSFYNNDYIVKCNKYKSELSEVKYLINNINHTLSKMCQHDFVEDEIDINCDRSQKIEYCKICEYTKEYGFLELNCRNTT